MMIRLPPSFPLDPAQPGWSSRGRSRPPLRPREAEPLDSRLDRAAEQ